MLAPDLRGHGDSEWAKGGFYPSEGYVYDLAELVETQRLDAFDLIGHSLGGNVGLRYAALFPDKVRRIVAIEGLSHSPKLVAEQRAIPVETRLRDWIARQREIAAKPPRRYASLDEATARLAAEHPRLDPEFAAHLARHGVRDNGDGTVSFKFDPGAARLSAGGDCRPRTSGGCGASSPARRCWSMARNPGPRTPCRTAARGISAMRGW